MKKFFGIILIACCLMIGVTAQADDTTISFGGSGIAWSEDWGPDYYTDIVSDVPVSISLTANIIGLQLYWVLGVSVNDNEFQVTYTLDGGSGDLYFDSSNSYAGIWADSCWGDGDYCPVDQSKPDSVGNENIDIKINLTTYQGYISIHSNDYDNSWGTGSNFSFMGKVELLRTKENLKNFQTIMNIK